MSVRFVALEATSDTSIGSSFTLHFCVSSKVTLESLLHPKKAREPIAVVALGITMLVRFLQFSNRDVAISR